MNRIVLVSIIIGMIIVVSFAVFYVAYVVEMHSLSIPEGTNFTLYVSNQSVDNRLANIKVRIDDNLEVEQDFAIGNQHQVYPFYFKLSQGEHLVQVDAKDVSYQKEFTVDSELWMAIAYWYDKDDQDSPMILVDVSDGPIGFQ